MSKPHRPVVYTEDAASRGIRLTVLMLFALHGVVLASDPIDLPVRTIGGQDLAVPSALPGGALLIVGFTRRSLDQTRPWREVVDALGESAPPAFNVLVLEAAPRWVRWVIVRAARREASPEQHGSILIAAKDEAGWRKLVGFRPTLEDAAYVVRIDGRGQICFRHAGAVTDQALNAGLVADCPEATMARAFRLERRDPPSGEQRRMGEPPEARLQ